MKISLYKPLLCLLFFWYTHTSLAQFISSSCEAADSIVKRYRNDADRLAIRYVNEKQANYKDSVHINKEISKDYLNALLAVHNSTSCAAVDTITRFLDIHTYNPGLNSLIVVADSNLIWMRNLRYHIEPTNDYFIDKIMTQYSLEVVFYSGLLQPSMLVFKTKTNSNLAPLAQKLKTQLGVTAAEAEFLYGDGNDISGSVQKRYIELVYSFGWQNCPKGCELRRYWKFRVFSDCSVFYAGSYGSELEPSLVLTLIKDESLLEEMKIYANPIKNKLYVEGKAPKLKETSLAITNKKGKVVYTMNSLADKQELNLILLSVGDYTLTLTHKKKQAVFKMVKQ